MPLVSREKIACAVQQSTMDKLKEGKAEKVDPKKFFGSRSSTEAVENLTYPEDLLQHFQQMGLFDFARSLGYVEYTNLSAAQRLADAYQPSEVKGSYTGDPWIRVAKEDVFEPKLLETATQSDVGSDGIQTTQSFLRKVPLQAIEASQPMVSPAMSGLVVGLLFGMALCHLYHWRSAKASRRE
ncbi:unnamed protein product [Effrenium voratum]|nr:unnamed protein product [Effrenium voratum]